MIEPEFTEHVLGLCKSRGLLVHHCRDSRYCTGSGFPDLIIISVHGVLFVELKQHSMSKTSPDQTAWRYMLQSVGITCLVFTVAEMDDLTMMLDELASP